MLAMFRYPTLINMMSFTLCASCLLTDRSESEPGKYVCVHMCTGVHECHLSACRCAALPCSSDGYTGLVMGGGLPEQLDILCCLTTFIILLVMWKMERDKQRLVKEGKILHCSKTISKFVLVD